MYMYMIDSGNVKPTGNIAVRYIRLYTAPISCQVGIHRDCIRGAFKKFVA